MRDMTTLAGLAALVAAAGIASGGMGGGGGQMLTIADSAEDYNGNQGENGWFYGYYDGDAGAGSWTPEDFELMNIYDEDSDRWWVDNSSGGPLTLIDSQFMHPNAFISTSMDSTLQWAVRRWVSDLDGPINIHVDMARANAEFAGDGVKLRVFVDGVQQLAIEMFANNDAGIAFDLSASVAQGSVIDFAIDPIGNAIFDATDFHAIITSNVPGPSVLASLGLAGLLAGRRRR